MVRMLHAENSGRMSSVLRWSQGKSAMTDVIADGRCCWRLAPFCWRGDSGDFAVNYVRQASGEVRAGRHREESAPAAAFHHGGVDGSALAGLCGTVEDPVFLGGGGADSVIDAVVLEIKFQRGPLAPWRASPALLTPFNEL